MTDEPGIDRPEIVFWSDFPLGYHNREAEEKMARFAARGYPVHYVEKIGIRNPRTPAPASHARGAGGAPGRRERHETVRRHLAEARLPAKGAARARAEQMAARTAGRLAGSRCPPVGVLDSLSLAGDTAPA